MNSLNSILLEGNLVRNPEAKTSSRGFAITTFTVASNRYKKMEDGTFFNEVSYFDVESWSTLAERCAKELAKGRGVRVVGRLKQNRWEDAEGNVKSRIIIVAEHVDFKPVYKQVEPAESDMDDIPSDEDIGLLV